MEFPQQWTSFKLVINCEKENHFITGILFFSINLFYFKNIYYEKVS